MTSQGRDRVAVALLLGVCIGWWAPMLAGGQTLLAGDFVVHGLPLTTLFDRALRGHATLFWTHGLYGGHPIFAEGQGGFLDPVRVVAGLVGLLTTPLYAENLSQFLNTVIAGSGMYALAREAGASSSSALAATITVLLSPTWSATGQNITILASAAWSPWTFWAAERCLRHPGWRTAAVLGGVFALIMLGGYPQIAHGVMLTLSVRAIWTLAGGGLARRRSVAGWMAFAGFVAIGLSAVQWLPLGELAVLSHRNGGVELIKHANNDAEWWNRRIDGALIAALACLVMRPDATPAARARDTGLAVLAALGYGDRSPLFGALYDHHVIPGLHLFRSVFTYGNVFAALTVPSLARALDGWFRRGCIWSAAPLLVLPLALFAYYQWPAPVWPLWSGIAAVIAAGLIGARGPVAAVAAGWLACGSFLIDGRALPALPAGSLREPAAVRVLHSVPNGDQYLTFDDTLAILAAMSDPKSPPSADRYVDMLDALVPSIGLIWRLPSFQAALALPLTRHEIALRAVERELREASGHHPIMDALSVRYFSRYYGRADPGGFDETDARTDAIRIADNRRALPPVRLYGRHVAVADPREALDAMRRDPGALAVETARVLPDAGASAEPGVADPIKTRDGYYRIETRTNAPAWLFVVDAPYPGWRATVDGERVDVFAADVLGKAVRVPAGRHLIEMWFRPWSIWLGAAISAITVLGVFCVWLVGRLARAGRVPRPRLLLAAAQVLAQRLGAALVAGRSVRLHACHWGARLRGGAGVL